MFTYVMQRLLQVNPKRTFTNDEMEKEFFVVEL